MVCSIWTFGVNSKVILHARHSEHTLLHKQNVLSAASVEGRKPAHLIDNKNKMIGQIKLPHDPQDPPIKKCLFVFCIIQVSLIAQASWSNIATVQFIPLFELFTGCNCLAFFLFEFNQAIHRERGHTGVLQLCVILHTVLLGQIEDVYAGWRHSSSQFQARRLHVGIHTSIATLTVHYRQRQRHMHTEILIMRFPKGTPACRMH
jgi:hypothetical protein